MNVCSSSCHTAVVIYWGTYRTNQPGGAVMQLGLHAVSHQCPVIPGYAAFIHYILHLLTYVVNMPYSCNSWCLKELKDELKKKKQRTCSYV